MRPVCLIPKSLDSVLFQYNMELGIAGSGHDHHYVRQITYAQASPGVTWQDIVAEFEANINDPNYILKTTSFVHHRYLLYMTVKNFFQIATHRPQRADLPYPSDYELVTTLAKELIAYRDYEAAGGYRENPTKTTMDFYPKD